MKQKIKAGFTLIELLVVIAIIAGLATLGFTMFGAIDDADAGVANDRCKQIADAFVLASKKLDTLPSDQNPIPDGVNDIDPDICAILAKDGGFSVAYLSDTDSDENARGLEKNKNADAELKYGLLSPIGLKLFEAGASESKIKEHLIQFVYDKNGDGQIDTADGMPKQLLPDGEPIAGRAAVWCWAEDDDARSNYEVLGKSW